MAMLLPAFPANLRKQLKGAHYPAPHHIMCAAVEGAQVDFDTALRIEGRWFADLVGSPIQRNMTQAFFFDLNHLNRGGSRPSGVPRSVAGRVGVVGAGMMGAGIAYACARVGLDVVLVDVALESAERGKAYSEKLLDQAVQRGRSTVEKRDALLARITPSDDLSTLAGCDVVIEAVFEDLALKQDMVRAFEEVNPTGIFASNTSSIPITKIAAASRHPETVLGMHYFSPVQKMPLLEVIVTEKTSPEATATAVALGKKQGKTVIVVGDGPGFYTSRILAPYMNEAAALLVEGAAVEDLDRALVQFGFPVGPITLLDEVGIDVGEKVGKILHDAFGARMAPPAALHDVVAAGRLGRKNKKGFYTYGDDQKEKRVDVTVYDLLPGGRRRKPFAQDEIRERVVLQMVNEAIRCLGEGILRSARDGDVGAVFGLGWPPFRGGPFRWVDTLGSSEVLSRMEKLRDRHGARFEPAPLLVEHGKAGRPFRG
jgi:3-hydroxyacyl-CoA dehydrogenase/enoyl-CoA hydratase/3-hydroxybutyryl-CoA epimerase